MLSYAKPVECWPSMCVATWEWYWCSHILETENNISPSIEQFPQLFWYLAMQVLLNLFIYIFSKSLQVWDFGLLLDTTDVKEILFGQSVFQFLEKHVGVDCILHTHHKQNSIVLGWKQKSRWQQINPKLFAWLDATSGKCFFFSFWGDLDKLIL